MQQLFMKLNNFCMKVSSFMLDNGKGRAKPLQSISEAGDPSGFSVFIDGIIDSIVGALLNVAEFFLRCILRIAYFVMKLCLNIMDFMNIVIKNLSGQATAFSLKENSNLAESDILFQFLFNDLTIKILQAVFVFSLLLLIIFTIMAIVRNEWQNHITGKQNSVKRIFRKVIISLFTTLIVPFILIVGIVFSNVLLASAMSALTKRSGSYSLGAQIFSSSSYDANRYRSYAAEGKKIPIVFDFDGGFENSVTTEIPNLTEESTSDQENQLNNIIASGAYTTGQTAYKMFKDETFYTFSSVPDSSAYYQIYDGEYLKTKQIEYYAMADFLDFALSSGGTFYVTNVEKVYESVMKYIAVNGMPRLEETPVVYDYIFNVLDNLIAYDENNKEIIGNGTPIFDIAEKIVYGEIIIDHIDFTVYYNEERANVLSTSGLEDGGTINYTSVAGSTDEVTGAKYLFCHKIEVGEDGDYFYVPVRLGDEVNGTKFKSNFLCKAPEIEGGGTTRDETVFLARGVFATTGYPTAIREEGSNIVYYRQDPESPSSFNYSEIFNYTEPGSTDNSGGMSLSNAIELFTGVDISTLIPDVQVNLNFLRAYTKGEYSATTLNGGKFTVNYSFVGSNLSLQNLYDELKINYVVLLFACVTLFMSLFYIIWGLIQRLFEITLLWITMPGWIAKFPIEKDENIGEGSTSFKAWKERMIERVLALYAIYIALAIVLLLVPIVFNIDYITTFNIEETNIFGIFNADAANLVIKTAFVLVLFNFLNIKNDKDSGMNAPRIIEKIVLLSKADQREGYLPEVGEAAVKEVKGLANKAYGMFTPVGILKTVKGAALNTAKNVTNAIPGRNIADRIHDHGILAHRFNKQNDAMLKGAQTDLTSKDTEAEITAASDKLNSATKDHTYLEEYRTARSDYWRRTPEVKGTKKNKKTGKNESIPTRANRGNVAGMSGRMSEIAKSGGGKRIKIGKKKTTERAEYRKLKGKLKKKP